MDALAHHFWGLHNKRLQTRPAGGGTAQVKLDPCVGKVAFL